MGHFLPLTVPRRERYNGARSTRYGSQYELVVESSSPLQCCRALRNTMVVADKEASWCVSSPFSALIFLKRFQQLYYT